MGEGDFSELRPWSVEVGGVSNEVEANGASVQNSVKEQWTYCKEDEAWAGGLDCGRIRTNRGNEWWDRIRNW